MRSFLPRLNVSRLPRLTECFRICEFSDRWKGDPLYLTMVMALLSGGYYTQKIHSPCREWLVSCETGHLPTPQYWTKSLTKFNSRGSVIPKCHILPKSRRKATDHPLKAHIPHSGTLPLLAVTSQLQGHSLPLQPFHLPARTHDMGQEICHQGHIPVVT